jgi:serine/threonine-protein kinase
MDRLSHPNIVRVNGVDRFDGHIVIDMEYVKGRNLQQALRAEGRLPMERALHIAIQTLDALDYAHRMRTVHRDIKPANILLNRNDEVKLVDFGLAEILATNSYAGGAGTYAYMAPEDFSEEHHSDHLSDIWAVGVTLYEMLTAARPFVVTKAKDPFAWRKVLHTEPPVPLSEHMESVPSGLQEIMTRALARVPRRPDRSQHAAWDGGSRRCCCEAAMGPGRVRRGAAQRRQRS